MGRQIRTPPHRRASSAGLPPAGEQQEGRFVGGVGDEAYAKEVTSQLDSSKILRTFFVGSGRQASPLPVALSCHLQLDICSHSAFCFFHAPVVQLT